MKKSKPKSAPKTTTPKPKQEAASKRASQQELDTFVFKPKPLNKVSNLDEFYTIRDEQDYLDDNNNPRLKEDDKRTLAKKIHSERNQAKYMIKMNIEGKLHNPLSVVSKQKMQSNYLDRKCREPKFKRVTIKVFNMYLNFLRSKNMSWLHNANRETE